MPTPRAIGLDFGTTNSALAHVAGGSLTLAQFPRFDRSASAGAANRTSATFRSILYFPVDAGGRRDGQGRSLPWAGPWALSAAHDDAGSGRHIQSLKSHLGSRLFTKTQVHGRSYALEDLVAMLVTPLLEESEKQVGPLRDRDDVRVVCGRPVRFMHAENEDDDALAIARLREGLARAGLANVTFAYEPVGAAYHYERSLDHDELALIADFGGGTSDFSLVRVGAGVRKRGRRPEDVLGSEGVAIAGDAFDGAIVDHGVSPSLGAGSLYRPRTGLGSTVDKQTMAIPPWIYGKIRRWHLLSLLKSKETLDFIRELRRQALEPHKIEALLHLVEADLGLSLYRAVEATKVSLSHDAVSTIDFHDAPIEIDTPVARAAFDGWIAPDLTSIGACVDRLLERTNVAAGDVDVVFLTGGSSLVPAVRSLFAARFGQERLRSGDELTSVASGLARIAADEAAHEA